MKYFVPAILWAALILFLSSGAMPNLPKLWWEELISPDKIGHLGIYCIFSMMLLYGCYKKTGTLAQQHVIFALSIGIIYGILMEVMQYAFFPNRYFEFFDIIANIIGSLSAPYLFRKLIFKKS